MSQQIPSFKTINMQKHKRNQQFNKSVFRSYTKHGYAELQRARTANLPKLTSNWRKYDKKIDDECEGADSLTHIDLSHQSTRSIIPSHSFQFQLKRDKAFLPLPNSDHLLHTGDFFELDIELIGLGLAAVPFYERLGVDRALFNNEELQDLILSALHANSVYQNFIANHLSCPPNEESYENCSEVEIKTDNLEIPENSGYKIKIGEKSNFDRTKLEEWLDDVLDQ